MTLTQIKPAGLSKPVDLANNEKIRLGTGNDLEIYHDGNSKIQNVNNSCDLRIVSNSIELKSQSGDEFFQKCTVDGAVQLYYDNVKKLETYGSGVKIYSGHLRIVGDEGGESKLDLYADEGDDAYDIWQVKAGGSSDFYISGYNGSSFETSIKATGNGSVELYHNNTKMIETVDVGVKVGDSKRYVVGDDADGYLRYNSNTVELYVAHAQPFKVSLGGETALLASANGAVELYYDGSKKLHTVADGIYVTGNIYSNKTGTSAAISLTDNGRLAFGSGADLQIYHDGSNSRIENSTGSLVIGTTAQTSYKANTHQFETADGTETIATFNANGSCELRHDNSKRLVTTTNGINVNSGGTDLGSLIQIYGNDAIKRNYWGYSSSYRGIQIGRSDSNINSSIFMGVDPSANPSGAFGGYGQEIIFRNDLSFYHPNDANNNWHSFLRTGRFGDTGAVCFPNGLGFGSDTSTDNVLDDYEEGTFTPTNGTVGLNSANGRYTKIGNVVTFHLRAVFANNSSAVAAYIDGLPYNSAANWGGSYPHSCTIGYATGNHIQFALLSGGSDRIYLYDKQGASVQLTHFDNDDVRIGGSYIV